MTIFKDMPQWQSFRKSLTGTLGFVPTMGALHDGHLLLVKESLLQNDKTVVSIYVNPTQFNNKSDLKTYPSSLESDIEKLKAIGVTALLTPTYEQMYPDKYCYKVTESDFSSTLCGSHRLGHFDGVLTVVLKLLLITQADRAYFGEKDYQQLQLIRGMVEAFFIKTKIIPIKTIREADGLAMSSRNKKLTKEQRKLAAQLFEQISKTQSSEQTKLSLRKLGFKLDYLEEHFNRRFVAASLGDVRLIDNVEL